MRRQVRLPMGFDAWFAKAVAYNPADRFATATMAVNALVEVFGMSPLSAGGPSSSGMGPPRSLRGTGVASSPFITGEAVTGAPVERRKGALIAALSLGLVVIGGGIFFAVRALFAPSGAAASALMASTPQVESAPAPQAVSAPAEAGSAERTTIAPAVESAAAMVGPAGLASAPTTSAAALSQQRALAKRVEKPGAASSATSIPVATAAPSDSAKRSPLYSRE
jgi:eukaryotic-like serine/threonine-protein kinase